MRVKCLDWGSLVNAIINGVFVGASSAFGTWLVTKHFIKNLERLEEKLKDKTVTG